MLFFLDIYSPTNVCMKNIGSWASMVLQNYQHFIEMTSNMISIIAFGGGLKCTLKTQLDTMPPNSGISDSAYFP